MFDGHALLIVIVAIALAIGCVVTVRAGNVSVANGLAVLDQPPLIAVICGECGAELAPVATLGQAIDRDNRHWLVNHAPKGTPS